MTDVRFFVEGTPVQQGSKTPGRRKDGTSFLREQTSVKLVPWRREITKQAVLHWAGKLLDGPVWLDLTFYMPRGKTVKRVAPSVPPDLDKLVRAVCDALKGVIYVDDSRVVVINAAKVYTDKTNRPEPGVLIRVRSVS